MRSFILSLLVFLCSLAYMWWVPYSEMRPVDVGIVIASFTCSGVLVFHYLFERLFLDNK